jgi:hypothetical protein
LAKQGSITPRGGDIAGLDDFVPLKIWDVLDSVGHVLEQNFVVSPCMGQNCVGWYLVVLEVLDEEGARVEETNCVS